MNSFSVYRKRKKRNKTLQFHRCCHNSMLLLLCMEDVWEACQVDERVEPLPSSCVPFHSILLLFFLSPLVVTLRFWHFVFSFCWTD